MNSIKDIFSKLTCVIFIIIKLISCFFEQLINDKPRYRINILDLEYKINEEYGTGNPSSFLI
jgi:hypothetical protein